MNGIGTTAVWADKNLRVYTGDQWITLGDVTIHFGGRYDDADGTEYFEDADDFLLWCALKCDTLMSRVFDGPTMERADVPAHLVKQIRREHYIEMMEAADEM